MLSELPETLVAIAASNVGQCTLPESVEDIGLIQEILQNSCVAFKVLANNADVAKLSADIARRQREAFIGIVSTTFSINQGPQEGTNFASCMDATILILSRRKPQLYMLENGDFFVVEEDDAPVEITIYWQIISAVTEIPKLYTTVILHHEKKGRRRYLCCGPRNVYRWTETKYVERGLLPDEISRLEAKLFGSVEAVKALTPGDSFVAIAAEQRRLLNHSCERTLLWRCPNCPECKGTLLRPIYDNFCDQCNWPQPQPKFSWDCGLCNAENPMESTTCWACTLEAPIEKVNNRIKVLFELGWLCSTCSNPCNAESDLRCNSCRTPKVSMKPRVAAISQSEVSGGAVELSTPTNATEGNALAPRPLPASPVPPAHLVGTLCWECCGINHPLTSDLCFVCKEIRWTWDCRYCHMNEIWELRCRCGCGDGIPGDIAAKLSATHEGDC